MDTAKVLRDLLWILPVCWVISPLGMVLVGIIGESRMIPLTSDKQFESFWPGDWYLGLAVGIFWAIARNLQVGTHWVGSTEVRFIVLFVGIVVATVLTYSEWKGGIYPTRAVFSPTKIYHNGLLYVGYGFIAATSIITVVVRAPWLSEPVLWLLVLIALVCFGRWGIWVYQDSTLARDIALYKARHAHTEDWVLLPVLLLRD